MIQLIKTERLWSEADEVDNIKTLLKVKAF